MKRLFGTNGIRWKPDRSEYFNFPIKLGLALGHYFGKGKCVCIGMDARTTGPIIKAGVASGIMAAGCNVIDLGIVATPTVQFAVRDLETDGGVVISASHNPPEFNGIKCIASDGTELARQEEEKIERLFSEGVGCANWQEVGKCVSDHSVIAGHIDYILSQFQALPEDKKLTVIVDGSNGPGGLLTPKILSRLGCRVITINAQPDGLFPGRLPEPVEEHLGDLKDAVVDAGADFGVAHDGDADRAAFIDEKGRYVTGDKSLAIFAKHILSKEKGTVVVPVNTSKVVIDTVKEMGGAVKITPVGSPLIARKIAEIGGVFGGEGNGGAIFPKHMFCRDGMMSACQMVQIVAEKGSLSQLVDRLPRYTLKRTRVACPEKLKPMLLQEMKKHISAETSDIDGLKIVDDDWWVLLRASGTEPIFRITAEAKDEGLVDSKLAEFRKLTEDVIQVLSP